MADDEYIRFRCSRCTHGLKVKACYVGKKVYCPACYYELKVPAASEADRRSADPSQLYGVDAEPRDTRQMTDRFEFDEVDCPVCWTKIAVRENQIGTQVECPDCGTQVLVTALAVAESRKQRKNLNRPESSDAPPSDQNAIYGISSSDASAERLDTNGNRIALGENRESFHSVVQNGRFAVYCPLCATMQYATVGQIGQQIRCPECERDFMVFRPVELAPKKNSDGIVNFEGGTVYGIAGESRALLSAVDQRAEGYDPSTDPNLVPVVCKLCGTLMHAPRTEIGRMKKCPDCETETLIEAPRQDRTVRTEHIEPMFTGGYAVSKTPSAEERFHHEPDYLLGKIKTPIEKKLEEERRRQSGFDPLDRPVPSSPHSSPAEHYSRTSQPSHAGSPHTPSAEPPVQSNDELFSARKKPSAPRERFVPESHPATPVTDAVNRRNKPPALPTAAAKCPAAPTVSSAKPYRRPLSPEEKTLAGLAALEQNAETFDPHGLEGFVPDELPHIDPRKKTRRVGKKSKKRKKSAGSDEFGGLIPKRTADGNVIFVPPSPPDSPMSLSAFSPLAEGFFWSHWLTPALIGSVVWYFLFRMIGPVLERTAGQAYSPAGGMAMIVASSVAAVALMTAVWIRFIAVNFFSVFFGIVGGSETVEEWLEEDFVGGIVAAGRLFLMVAVAIAPVTFLVQLAVGSGIWTGLTGILSVFLFFPIVFLSTMQSSLPVLPISGVIFWSMRSCFGAWLAYYFWSALFGIVPLVLLGLLSFVTDGILLTILSTAYISLVPPVISVLLGRLGWVIEDAQHGG